VKVCLTRVTTYLFHPTQEIYRRGQVYEVDQEKATDLLSRADDAGIPFFRVASSEDVELAEKGVVLPKPPRKRGRRAGATRSPAYGGDEIDTAAEHGVEV